KEPRTSALSAEPSPLKMPPSLIITYWQSSNFASRVPSTISRLQEAISPENDVSGPTIIVRTSTSLLRGRACVSVSDGEGVCTTSVLGRDRSLARNESAIFPETGQVRTEDHDSGTAPPLKKPPFSW